MVCGYMGKQIGQPIWQRHKYPRNQVHTSLWNTRKCSTGSRWLARCMWRVRQQLPPVNFISVNETLELLNCKILRVNKWHTNMPLQLQTPCSTRCVASFLHLCQIHLILQTAVRMAYNRITTLHKPGWKSLWHLYYKENFYQKEIPQKYCSGTKSSHMEHSRGPCST
jgi:hypothetical protein